MAQKKNKEMFYEKQKPWEMNILVSLELEELVVKAIKDTCGDNLKITGGDRVLMGGVGIVAEDISLAISKWVEKFGNERYQKGACDGRNMLEQEHKKFFCELRNSYIDDCQDCAVVDYLEANISSIREGKE